MAEWAVALYAERWAAQARLKDESARVQTRCRIHGEMLENMERQLAERGYYVPFSPVRMVVARKKEANL